MAARFYGVALGGSMPTDVTEALTTPGKDFEFQIANTTLTGTSKLAALKALEAITNYITNDTWPPA